ncbi:putative Mtf2-like C-terminal domain-containing protein [Seiridium cardinale]|uniref:Mtf2-like C-terminal domain-containing protein n=1 Tax=Seiridium cardinale TaxID=138064 RepID=A0ABR2XR54_9PEZI
MSAPPLLFLYQTRTLLRCRRLPSIARSLHVTPARRSRGENDIPFAQDGPGADIPVGKTQTRGTITPTERETFDRIFADIAARGLKPRMQQDVRPASETTRRATNLIIEAAAAVDDAGGITRGKPISAAQYVSAARDKDKALLRFPPSLRAAASRAFELLNPDHPAAFLPPNGKQTTKPEADETDETAEMWQTPKNSILRAVEVDAKRQPEQKRVERLMSGAQTDFELWDIMEQEVFCYPQKLGLKKSAPRVRISKARTQKEVNDAKIRRGSRSPIATPTNTDVQQFSDDPKLNLYIYGPLYPSFLLFGLRLLDKGFAAPSSLALSVLPRIKELGLESFVLGVSTPFYNELLSIQYSRFGDLSNMMNLLEEMSHSGLYFDEGTVAVLNRAYNHTGGLSAGNHGPFAEAIMTMPAYEQSVRDLLRDWHRNVDFSMKQRDADIDFNQWHRQ